MEDLRSGDPRRDASPRRSPALRAGATPGERDAPSVAPANPDAVVDRAPPGALLGIFGDQLRRARSRNFRRLGQFDLEQRDLRRGRGAERRRPRPRRARSRAARAAPRAGGWPTEERARARAPRRAAPARRRSRSRLAPGDRRGLAARGVTSRARARAGSWPAVAKAPPAARPSGPGGDAVARRRRSPCAISRADS